MDSQYLIEGYIFISHGVNVLQESAYKRKMYLGRQAGASAESGVVPVFSMLRIT